MGKRLKYAVSVSLLLNISLKRLYLVLKLPFGNPGQSQHKIKIFNTFISARYLNVTFSASFREDVVTKRSLHYARKMGCEYRFMLTKSLRHSD